MNTKKLLKEVGLKQSGKIVDLYETLLDDDTEEGKKLMRNIYEHLDGAITGDVLVMFVVRFPNSTLKNKKVV